MHFTQNLKESKRMKKPVKACKIMQENVNECRGMQMNNKGMEINGTDFNIIIMLKFLCHNVFKRNINQHFTLSLGVREFIFAFTILREG